MHLFSRDTKEATDDGLPAVPMPSLIKPRALQQWEMSQKTKQHQQKDQWAITQYAFIEER